MLVMLLDFNPPCRKKIINYQYQMKTYSSTYTKKKKEKERKK